LNRCGGVGRLRVVQQAESKGAEITLYTGEYCPYCRRVKGELERLGLPYRAVNADKDGRETVVALSGQRAIPILTIGDDVLVDSKAIIRELRRRYAS
jgi:glutathione S-transferase